MPRVITALVTAAVAATAVVLSADAALAQVAVVDDAGTADVWAEVYDPESGEFVWEEAGSLVNSDVEKATVKHTDKNILITIKYADLVKRGDITPTYRSWFKLSDGRAAVFTVWIDNDWNARLLLQADKSAKPGTSGRAPVTCPGKEATWHWSEDTLTKKIPRSCFAEPSWVKFHGMSAAGITGDEQDLDQTVYWDNAQNAGHDHDGYTGRIKAG